MSIERKMTDFDAVMIAEEGNEDREKVRAAWQHLVDTGLAWKLQGWFGRTATTLIASGEIKPYPRKGDTNG